MTTVYLHIGLPKTATTSLQQFLFDNQTILQEKGYLYPKTAINLGGISHHFFSTMAKSSNDNRWQELNKEIEEINPKNIVISTENLTVGGISFDYSERLNCLKNQLRFYQVKVIIYLRRQDLFFDSLYRQLVKMGYIKYDIHKFIKKVQEQYNYELILEQWANIFCTENIIVRCFEKKQLVNQNIYDDFLEAIAFPNTFKGELLLNNNQINVSPSVKMIKILAWLNSINRKKRREFLDKIPIISWDKFLIYFYQNSTISSLIEQIPDNWLSNKLLSLKDRQQIMQNYVDINKRIAQKYLKRRNGQLFFETLS